MKNIKRCSFCGYDESELRIVVKGIHNNYICEKCIDLCNNELDILKKQKEVDKKENLSDKIDETLDIEFLNIHNKEGEKENIIDEKLDNNIDKKEDYFLDLNKDYDFKFKDVFKDNNNEILNNTESNKLYNTELTFEDFRPSKLKKELDQYIIGQDEAKKILSVAVYNHYKRIQSDKEINKGNVLMIGPTGSGKTYLLQRLASIIEVPLITVDATSFTEAGYVGDDVESIIHNLFLKSGKNKELTERGIVYIDEIDKIASKTQDATSTVDVGGVGVQQSLLKIMEGSEIEVVTDTLFKDSVKIDTSNILFVCGGAFSEMSIKNKKNNTIGFNKKINSNIDDKDQFYSHNIIHDDIINYGFIPEFVGRVPVIVQLNKLTESDLCDILVKSKNSIIKEYKDLFAMDNIELTFDDEAIKYIAREAFNKNIGARGLRGVIEQKMYDIMFKAPDKDIKQINITQKMLE